MAKPEPDFDSAHESTHERPSGVRHLVVLAATLMAVLLYLDRFCVSFAADFIREDLALTQNEIGWFLSAFFWSYALAQVPSGWLSDRYGVRITLALYILTWSVFTAVMGAAQSLVVLLLARLCFGVAQAGAYPASASLISKWVPVAKRGGASAMVSLGGRMGGAIAPLLTAWLITVFVPRDVPVDLTETTLLKPAQLAARLAPAADADAATQPTPAGAHLWSLLPSQTRPAIAAAAEEFRALERAPGGRPSGNDAVADDEAFRSALLAGLNSLLSRTDLYYEDAFRNVNLPREALATLGRIQSGENVETAELRRYNRFLLEGSFRDEVGKLYTRGWRPVMVVYGLAGIFVAALFWFVARDRPSEHPGCNAAERDLIAAGRPADSPNPAGTTEAFPLGPMLKSGSLWLLCLNQVGTNLGWVFLVTLLPRYLLEVHDVPILKRGLLASIPLAVGFAGMFAGGRLTDRLTLRMGVKWGRRIPVAMTRFLGAAAYAACIAFGSMAFVPAEWAPWLFTAAFATVAFATDMGVPATWAFNQDVGGRYVGAILGWGNMWGNLGAAVAPPLYVLILGNNPGLAEWNLMFLFCGAAFVFAGLCGLGIDATVPITANDASD